VFIFSLSEQSDQLSQWRGYTTHGQGVSIGINHEELYNFTRNYPIDADCSIKNRQSKNCRDCPGEDCPVKIVISLSVFIVEEKKKRQNRLFLI